MTMNAAENADPYQQEYAAYIGIDWADQKHAFSPMPTDRAQSVAAAGSARQGALDELPASGQLGADVNRGPTRSQRAT